MVLRLQAVPWMQLPEIVIEPCINISDVSKY